MTRRLALTLLCLAALLRPAFAAKKPNFVWLVSEDNSKHYLKLFDPHGARTPRIAEMARHGLIYEHAFSNSPVCSVARTTLMTSCYGPRIGTQFHRKSTIVPMPPKLRMFPWALRNAGYYTANNRKKDYNAIEGKGVWDASSRRASWRGRAAGQPFFFFQSFPASHESSLHFNARTMRTQKTTTDPKTVFIPPYHPKTPTFRYTYARYHDRIMEIDRQIGQVLDRLKREKLLEDTFVFYFGDHGGVLPRSKGYLYESGLHVPLVVRVPKNFRHLVDAKPGTRVEGFVSFVDFGATLRHLAGLKSPGKRPVNFDGKPFLGKDIKIADVNKRDEAFGYADRFDEKYDLVRTLRKGKFKYMRNYQPFNFDGLQNNYRYRMLAFAEWRTLYKAGGLNETQRQFFEPRAAEALYYLGNDPHETKNLAGDPKYAEVLKSMRERLREWVKGMPDLSFYPESELAKSAFKNPTGFGWSRRKEIANLVDIADLSLLPFAEAKAGIAKSLASRNPWERYWGLIACSSHGKAAKPFVDTAKKIAAGDTELLVRVRSAEFLGLIGAADPRPVIMDVLKKSESGIETTLILNSVVLLRDGKPGYAFKVTADDLSTAAKREPLVKRRLDYLTGKLRR